ncbi:MAG: NAD-dependent epimerase/dehydratase family protein [Candidatus Marinimicrobia bacterium]|nr:NAD-dependent epimerase/dehydratase family protein [Candidatus Neomarinimicrobiota bacterium]MED5218689.1 NAD-dependent epimerase/dehydratase family protein [Candidatus Neomarinimicrobiota bacterium]MED5427180.1 NAD-dependent epimerase/dehydratase family protein [Candidatus Neomarinimicrobiota bacterium]
MSSAQIIPSQENQFEERSEISVLVTGANGFLGNNLCLKLLAAGHEVRVFRL